MQNIKNIFFKFLKYQFIVWTIFFNMGVLHVIAAPVNVDIPFESSDVGLKNYEGPDNKTLGARDDGTTQINNAINEIITWFRRALGIVAVTWLVWQGYRMLSSQGDESQFETAQTSIMWSVIALVMSFLIEPFIRNVIYGGGDLLTPGQAVLDPETSTNRGIEEIRGLRMWIRTMLGILSVGMIIFTGIRAMIAYDQDDEINNQKRNIKAIMMGIIILIFNFIVVDYGLYINPHIDPTTGKAVTSHESLRVIMEFSGFIGYILMFFAMAAVAALVYGGYLIITASVDESQAETGKNIVMNVGIGIVIAFIAFTLVRTVIFLQS